MSADRVCARCGAVRHTPAGVCPRCGHEGVAASAGSGHSRFHRPADPPSRCPHCGADYDWGTPACGECGNLVSRACPGCGAANSVGNHYCVYCGERIGHGVPRLLDIGTRFALPSFAASTTLAKAKTALLNAREELDLFDGEPWLPSSRKARLAVEIALISILTLAGLLVRVWDIGTVPPAPAGDESAVALETIRILNGEWIGLWSGAALGNPSGHMYWIAPFFWLGGPTLTALRLASALPGVMLIPICYLMVRMLFPFKVALVAVGLLTFFSWFVVVYRIGIPVTLSIFAAALSLCLVIYAARSSRPWVAIIAGLVLGAGLYVFKGYVIYFITIWAATLLVALVNPGLRRQWTLYLFLGASLIAGAAMITFYLATDYLTSNLQSQYQVSGTDLLSLPRHLDRMFDVLMYVHNPPDAGGFGFDGIIPEPLLHPVVAIFFWTGALITLLFINRIPFQLLILGWLIGMAPAILVPGGETRRYLFGVFFVLVITAIGYTGILSLVINRWFSLGGRSPLKYFGVKRQWLGYFLAAFATLVFIGPFAVQNLSAFTEWTRGQETKFQFDPEIAEAARFMGTLDEGQTVRFYSVRWSVDYETVRWFAPLAQGVDGSEEFGGDGTIFSSGVVDEPTVFMLLGGYLHLIDDLKATYPDGLERLETGPDGQTLFIAYAIDTPPPPGTVKAPPNYRSPTRPAKIDFRVGGVRIMPDPAELEIRAAPREHHALDLVSSQSVLIVPRPAETVKIHNNPDLQGENGCETVQNRPEGDTRLSIILPNAGKESRSLFYVVGCAAGPAALDVMADGTVLDTYAFTITDP
ncbi:MAG: hypothetical protein F4X64_07615 [Chloroflexi bacterium]|nr:hypothetical protein [Chloroflexota bacterium]